MALSKQRKAELAKMQLPSDAEMRLRAERFRHKMGLTLDEFSIAVGYSSSSLGVYLQGHYGDNLTENHDDTRNTCNIRAALKQYMDLWEGEKPVTEDRAPYPTQDYLAVRQACLNALEHGWAYVIDGPPGTQKTFSLRAAEREINAMPGRRAIRIYTRVNHAPQGFLRELCNLAGIPNRGTIDQLLRKLKGFLGDERIALLIDEANHLGHDGLEVVRQLLDEANFGVVLAGSHDLTTRLSSWVMEQWRSRVRKTLLLNGPSVAECADIIRAELGPHSDTEIKDFLKGCYATASRTRRDGAAANGTPGKLASCSFRYISARDLFFTIEGIQQQLQQARASATPGTQPAAQKESAA
jgi:DNA transposition AAA+ family ATPase